MPLFSLEETFLITGIPGGDIVVYDLLAPSSPDLLRFPNPPRKVQ